MTQLLRWLVLLWVMCATGCGVGHRAGPDLDAVYGEAARNIGPERNPVIVIPGILGSRLIEPNTGQVVWGAFTYGAADADFPEGARLFALPMEEGKPLSALRDEVVPDGVLESLEVNVGLARVTALEPYRGIIRTLAAGRYVDRDIAQANAGRVTPDRSALVDGSGEHYTCFQFDYDWRRDISENAARLDVLVCAASEIAGEARGGHEPAKVDIVAHSMGGLVARYYVMYGTQPLPEDGSLPAVTWEGAERVNLVMLVGTPNAGSVLALRQLVEGVRYAAIVPEYRPAVIGTMPSVYQLLPRQRHGRLLDAASGGPVDDLFDVGTWERYGWGLADPDQDRWLSHLLPDVPDPAQRRQIALDHLRKCLARSEQLHRALDVPATPPAGLSMQLVAGDGEPTAATLAVDGATGSIRVSGVAPGDGTVTRSSALMDERVGGDFVPRLRTPIGWDEVQFIPANHIGLTTDPVFVDWMLYQLLERPRTVAPGARQARARVQ